jgi:trimeric autotransporter adhesin
MDKKKAVKLATASAVAASAFVAANPNASEAATNVATVVSQAKAQFKKAYYTYSHTVTETGEFPNINDVYAEYNKAKKAYADAVALVKKSGGANKDAYLADLDATYKEYITKRVVTYIDAYNYALKLDGLRQQLDEAIKAKDLAKAEELYHKISYELNKRTVILDRVYGQSTRELLRTKFKAEAQKLRDSLIYDITVAMKAREAQDAVKAGNLDKAKAAVDKINEYLPKVTDAFKAQLTDEAKKAVDAYEAALAPKVESVSAINAKKIEVKFNKEVNETTAENPATYNFVGLAAGTTWTPELQADGKTVVLTLNNAIANDTTFVAIVNEVETKADSTKKTEKFTKTITFSDTTKPTFTGVTYPEAGTAVLNFSEDLSTPGTVKVYDGNTDVTSTLTITHNANSNQISISGLTTNKEYRVVVVGAKDQSSNLIPSPVEVFVKSTVSEQVKPVIESITTVDLNTIKVKFSEKLKQISAGVYANVSIDGVAVAGATQTFDSETNTLTITKAGLTTAGIHSVSISGYTDLSNNVGDTFTKAVAFAASAPVLEKTEVVSDATDTYVVLTFNEAPSLAAIQGVDITGTYTTPENILKTFGSAALNESTDISVVGNTIKIKVTGKEAGNYKLTIPAAGISDGTTARTQDLEITFTLTGSADTTKPTVSNVFIPGEDATAVGGPATVERNTVYVKYSKPMNSTAVNPDNYTVDGQKVFESAVFVGDKTLVKLTLKEGVITLTGDRSFQISNAVTGENGVAINAYSSTEPFVENVKPILSSGVVIDGTTIELTFTEAVDDTNLLATGAGNDFEVYIDGAKSTIASVVTGATANDNKLQLQLSSAITPEQLASSTITVKVLDSTDGADVNGNPLTKGTVITVAK